MEIANRDLAAVESVLGFVDVVELRKQHGTGSFRLLKSGPEVILRARVEQDRISSLPDAMLAVEELPHYIFGAFP